jgi:uncharacterized protein (TIGR03000 family)
MYSLVLMTAMTTAPDTPDFNGYFRDLFRGNCAGCYGTNLAPRYSCYGGYGGCGSYYPASCQGSAYPVGCSGSFYNGCNGCAGDTFVNRVRRWFDSWGCCGGRSSSYGCGATAYSCFGGPAVSYTPVFNGGQSCYGGPIPFAPAPMFDQYPANPAIPGTAPPPPTIPYAPPDPAPGTNLNTGVKPAGHTSSALVSNGATGRATVIVKLPADARLFADARQLSLTGAERKFVSPELPAGQEFTYRFRIEYDRDGETVSVTKKVPVRAGGTVTVEFADLTAKNAGGATGPVAVTPTANPVEEKPVTPVAHAPGSPNPGAPTTDRATITVKLPAGAALYVNERRSPSTEAVRQFSTPPLPVGQEFSYLMKAEIVRNGQTETFTQKVPFRAGERVEVDFTAIGR